MYVISWVISNGSLWSSVSPLQIRLASHSFMHMPLKISKTIEFSFDSTYYSSLFQLFTKQKNAKINCSIKVTDKAQNLKSPLTYLQHSYMHRLCIFFNYAMLQKVWYDYQKILDIFVTFNKNALKILIFTQSAGIPIICFFGENKHYSRSRFHCNCQSLFDQHPQAKLVTL